MKTPKIGKCHICGVVGKLSYEHVPPAAAFNNAPTKVYKAIDVIENGGVPWDVKDIRGRILQQGSGGYTLCIKCNSFTGARYAKDFISACDQAMNSGQVEIRRDIARAQVGVHDINPLNFAKQVLAMFASVNHSRFFEAETDLRDLVLDESAFGINSDKYALFMYLYEGGMGRQVGYGVQGLIDGAVIHFSELTTIPFGFVMVFNPKRENIPDYGTEVTGLLNYEPDTVGNYLFEVPVFTQNSPMPLDFRSKEDILRRAQETGS